MSGPAPQPSASAGNTDVTGCHTVLIDFLAAIDHGHATTAVDLFTDDASFAAGGQQLHGRDAISRFLAEREAEIERHTVHLVANEVSRQVTDSEVELDALIVLFVRQPTGYTSSGSSTLPRSSAEPQRDGGSPFDPLGPSTPLVVHPGHPPKRS